MATVCATCGTTVAAEHGFCTTCGTPVPRAPTAVGPIPPAPGPSAGGTIGWGPGSPPPAGPPPAPSTPPAAPRRGLLPVLLALLVVVCVVAAALLAVQLTRDDASATATGGGSDTTSDAPTDPTGGSPGSGAPASACPADSNQPEILRYWQDATGIHVVIVIHTSCPTAQVLDDPAAAFGLFRGDTAYAEGRFDFSGARVTVPPGSTSGEVEILFGASARLDSGALAGLELPGSEGESVSEGFDLRYRFVCSPSDEGGAETATVAADAPADLGGSAAVDDAEGFVTEDLPEPMRGPEALAELERIAALDAPFVSEQLRDRWVPQLSSKALLPQDPIDDGTRVYLDHGDILDNYRELKTRFPSLRLINSSDYASFNLADYWVMVLGESYLDPGSANAWCDAQGIGPDDCFAKRISDGASDDNTEYR